jgi:ABC-2 type transport system permease protein
VVTGRPLGVLERIAQQALEPLLKRGAVDDIQNIKQAFHFERHVQYNPENITQYHTIPGLVGLILTMTLVLMTSMAITRERERGTMERLLVTPLKPLEVILGKIVPYIVIGYLQALLIVVISSVLFRTPFQGGLTLLFFSLLPFMAANLAVGLMFSSLAQNQLQAMQMTFFFFLPSVLLSGFVFPFKGMPTWAQWVGEILPLTHFNRIIRGILLKGNGLVEIIPELWPIVIFVLGTLALGVLRYNKTLD